MTAIFQFPDQVKITESLSNHPLLKTAYFQEKGITQAIANLAGERFANRNLVAQGIETEIAVLFQDLLDGEDGNTGTQLPNLGKLNLSSKMWAQIHVTTKLAIMGCAKAAKL